MLSSENIQYNFRLYQGATETPTIAFYSHYEEVTETDSDGNETTTINKTPINITDYSIEMTLKTSLGKKPVDYLSTDNGRIKKLNQLDDKPVNNVIEIQFPADVTSTYQYPELIYDIYAIDNDKNKVVLLYGKITIIKGVSHVF